LEIVARLWHGFADAVGGFIEEAAFRVELAFDVLAGRKPQRVERRWWNRSAETPTLVDAYSWVDERLIFSVIIWPSLESTHESADSDMRERTEQVLDAIARGASQRMWSTRWELDYGLRWDHEREVWTAGDGFAYAVPERGEGGLLG
jgi:hypothetical protein